MGANIEADMGIAMEAAMGAATGAFRIFSTHISHFNLS